MTHHDGDIVIRTAEDAQRYANIASVGGWLSIRADAQLPALTSVGGGLYISADAQLPALTSVGGIANKLPLIIVRGHWTAVVMDAHMMIGCELHSLADWEAFDDRRINSMATNALRFWRRNKAELLALAAGRHTTAEAA